MVSGPAIDNVSVTIALEIARKALSGDYDILLACRDICDLRTRLPNIPAQTLDLLIGVASETDDLPLGSERQHWSADALATKDREAADYRTRIGAIVENALREVVNALDGAGQALPSDAASC